MIAQNFRFMVQNLTGVAFPENSISAVFMLRHVNRSEVVKTVNLAENLPNGSSAVLSPADINTFKTVPCVEIEGIVTVIAPVSVNGSFMIYYEVSPDGDLWPDLGRGRQILTDTLVSPATINYQVRIS